VDEHSRLEWVNFDLPHTLDQSIKVHTFVCDCPVSPWQDAIVKPDHGEWRLIRLADDGYSKHLEAVHWHTKSELNHREFRKRKTYSCALAVVPSQSRSCWGSKDLESGLNEGV
jgi:hypothetical protein